MIGLLKNYLISKGCTEDDLSCNCQIYTDDFTLSDQSPCVKCLVTKPERSSCDRVVLSVSIKNNESVHLIGWENIINKLERVYSKRCDYILSGDRKVVFCELTCSASSRMDPFEDNNSPKIGKRAYAIEQIRQTIEFISLDEVLWMHIITRPMKIGIIGWRDYNELETAAYKNNAQQNMEMFMRTPSSEKLEIIARQVISGQEFSIHQVKYPRQYIW
jgi:hypothetical protein